ncbi:hypothetical protein QFC24_006203 [Naganishia onofrii]|uniref:Uncharacterized protein n=1 Tax=Naganishia onofrii TaxID=1851511 RepID=A0ACC2X2U8_9TREE|nr:hypothetical protein QFC24_006203 [Naganishia onofrii]
MEDDDVKQKVSPETVTVLETEGQPLRDDEQKLHMRSILVLLFATNIAIPLGGAEKSIWLSQSIAIATAVLSPVFSRGSDLFGRKYFVVGACVCGFVGGLVIGRATSMNMAIAGAAITGISYGAQPLAFAIPSEVMPRKYRIIANLGANVAGGIGAVLALLIGSSLMRNHHESKFRILFYISAAAYGFSAIVCQLFYNPPRLDSQVGSVANRLACMDWVGYALFTGALALFSMGLTWGKNPYPWSSPHVLAPLLVGLGLAVILIIHQWKVRRDGLFDRHIFSKSRNPGIVFAITNYYPIVAGVAFESDLRRVTTMLSIGFFTVFIVSPFIGLYSKIFKDVKWLTFSGFALFAAFFGAMLSVGLESRTGMWIFPVLFGLGLATGLTGLMAAAQFGAPTDSIATVSALVISSRSLGGSVGLAICEALCIADELQQETDAYTSIMLGTAIFSTRLSTQLPAQIASHVLPLGFNPQYLGQLIGGLSSQNIPAVIAIPGISPEIIAAGVVGLKLAFIAAAKYVWVVGIAITGAAAVVCLFIENLSQEYTAVIDHPVELKMETEISHKESS